MSYERYITPIVVALALSTGCKYGCGKDENNYNAPMDAAGQNHSGSQRNPGRRRSRNRTLEHSVKPEHVLAPKSGNYTSPQGVQYIIVVQPNYGRQIRITTSGRVVEGGNHSPKPSSRGCGNPPQERRALLAETHNLAGRLVDDVEDAVGGK
ncbi:MAG: hypothetical protein KJ955_07790 [Nanoarchaeota archaeon]|nr:hypothetical protein [Nanoarchaeota archaeon]